MKKLTLLSLLIIFSSCSKDEIVQEIVYISSSPIPETITTTPSFSSISEQFTGRNITTGFYKAQEYFTDYLSKSYIHSVLTSNDGHSTFHTFHNDTAILDLDGDDKQDILAFGTSFGCEHEYGSHPGKLIFISDYKNSSNKQVIDIPLYYSAKFEVNDFDGDGVSDVLIFPFNTRGNYYNSQEEFGSESRDTPPVTPILVKFKNSIQLSDVGVRSDHHGGTSGDIDNDGDIDFIQFPFPSFSDWDDPSISRTPSLLINENGIFTKVDLIRDLPENILWYASTVQLFDVNQDGFLDLITGWRIGVIKDKKNENNISNDNSGPVLMFGDGSGTFSLSNSIVLLDNVLRDKNYQAGLLGVSFTDLDNDDDIDIILSTTRAEPDGSFEDHTYYDNYHLVLFENINGSFIDSTHKISDSFGIDIPNFFSIRVVDKDNDGDYDLVPDKFANMGTQYYGNNIYWENNNGTFIRK